MSVQRAVHQQYQVIVDRAASEVSALRRPFEGWLRTVRKALDMSGAQLARKMGVTRARVAQAEQAELTGGITLKSMQATAEAMGCKFVYAIVPDGTIEELIVAQARKKAVALVGSAGQHMALESQALSNSQTTKEIERLTRDFAHDMPPDFWDDK